MLHSGSRGAEVSEGLCVALMLSRCPGKMMQSRELGEVRRWFCREMGIAVLTKVPVRRVCYTTRRNLDMATILIL